MCDFVDRLKTVAYYELGSATVAYLFVLRVDSEVQSELVQQFCEEIEKLDSCSTQEIQDENSVGDVLRRAAFGEAPVYLWA